MEEKIEQLIQIVKELGWELALPKYNDDEVDIKGMIIGEGTYINYILKHL